MISFESTPKSNIEHPIFSNLNPKIVAQFWKFHQENPDVYVPFRKYALEVRNAGWKKYGVAAIIEQIRWHCDVIEKGKRQFKIGNNLRSCYGRLLAIKDPSFEGFFEFRRSPGTVPLED